MKGQDLLLLLNLIASPEDHRRPYAALGTHLRLSASQVHAAAKRLIRARLLRSDRTPRRPAVRDFVLHGMRYVFPAEIGGLAVGIRTAWSAPPLSAIVSSPDIVVWPHSRGTEQGFAVEPIHRVVPSIVTDRPRLYELLALADCIRIGRIRERREAERELSARILDG